MGSLAFFHPNAGNVDLHIIGFGNLFRGFFSSNGPITIVVSRNRFGSCQLAHSMVVLIYLGHKIDTKYHVHRSDGRH